MMILKNKLKINLFGIGLFLATQFLLVASPAYVYAAPEDVEALNSYCEQNFSKSLPDGTDAEIVCRVGDPNNILNDNPSYWEALTDGEKLAQRNKDHCAEIYEDTDETDVVSNCRKLVDPHTGVPVVATLPSDCNETNDSGELNSSNCGIIRYLVIFTNALSAIVGIVIVVMMIVGGIQYSAARDNPQAIQAAKSRITNAILALVVYLFFYGFLNYLIPGGLF